MKVLKARGKLLISAEYMVLHGSLALALPLKKGQSMELIGSDKSRLFSWKAFREEGLWFSAVYDSHTLDVVKTDDQEKAEHLRKLLGVCMEMNPLFWKELREWDVETRLDFSPDWGLGSSSSLTALLAQWAAIDPLDLHFRISRGSGYDVACAITGRSIVYSLSDKGPGYKAVSFKPPFASRLYFVWLEAKQPTASHLAKVADRVTPYKEDIDHFTRLTQSMLEAGELSDFQNLMEEHEARLSAITRQQRVSETHFPGLQGSVKSLGAWGGDFVMIASEQEPAALFNYLDKLGLTTRFRYNDLVYGA